MTIEEGWKIIQEEFLDKFPISDNDKKMFHAVFNATWKIASKNQQKIDIEKACEVFINYLRKDDLWRNMSNDEELDWKIKFKQAMEE